MRPPTLSEILRLDAAANLAGAVALGLLAPVLAGPVGLAAAWPLWLLAAGLAIYGVENWLTSRRPHRRGVLALIAVDALFAAAVVVLVVADPTGAEPWVRGVLLAVTGLALIAGAVKAHGLRHRGPRRAAPPRQPV